MNIIERIDRPCEYVEVAADSLDCLPIPIFMVVSPDRMMPIRYIQLATLMAFEFVMVIRDFLWQLCRSRLQYGCLRIVC